MKRLLKRLSLQWRITLLTILLLATACVTMKTLLCSSGHAYMDSIGNYVMHYVQEDPQAIRVDIPNEQWKDLSERFNGEFVLELSGAKHSFCIRGWYIALAVTALGGDAAAFGTKPDGTTIDLIADGCYDCVVEGGPGAQGLNGWIFALLAMDAGGYQAPEGARYTRETIIEAIISAQGEDGGFSLTGDALDADITAMALQALAPYADGQAEVIDRALAALSAAQCADGGFASWGAENAESTAQVVMALCALGIE